MVESSSSIESESHGSTTLCIVQVASCIMSSSNRKFDHTDVARKRVRIVSELASIDGVSKGSLSKVLKALHDKGLLVDALLQTPSAQGYDRQVRCAFEIDAHKQTPYGPLIRELQLPVTQAPGKRTYLPLCYIHPFALLSEVCSVSPAFFNLLRASTGGTEPLRILIYFDGINPGNPLAPDPELLLQAIYWSFADLPHWFLHRKDSWFVFALVREKWAKKLPGGMSELCKLVLLVFFGESGDSFLSGLTILSGSEAIVVSAVLCGFLADEKALKELFAIKGQAGNVLCPFGCLNIRNRWVDLVPGDGLQHFWDPDLTLRKQCRREHVRAMLKRLSDAQTVTRRRTVEKAVGILYVPTGLLFNAHLMDRVVDPCTNYLRDWMHTLLSGGVASIELGLVCAALNKVGIDIDIVRAYALKFNSPYGTNKFWFKPQLVEDDHVKNFASDTLSMVTIMHSFLIDKIRPRGLLEPNIDCFKTLFSICCTLRRGTMSVEIRNALCNLVVKHNSLFLTLYGDAHAKIKFHHLYHLPEDVFHIGQCISCFPLERKNKDALAVAVATDMRIERTSVISFLHKTLASWNDPSRCQEMFLHSPRMHPKAQIWHSHSATLPCGEVRAHDMVRMVDGSIGKVASFWQAECEGAIIVAAHIHLPLATKCLYSLTSSSLEFVHAREILEPMCWYARSDAIFAAIPDYGK
jgi:hypothetical protein